MFDSLLHTIPTKEFVISYGVFKGVFLILGAIVYRKHDDDAFQKAGLLYLVIDFPVPSFFIPSTWLRDRFPMWFILLNLINGIYFSVWMVLIATSVARIIL